jgi:hypothetical protein
VLGEVTSLALVATGANVLGEVTSLALVATGTNMGSSGAFLTTTNQI